MSRSGDDDEESSRSLCEILQDHSVCWCCCLAVQSSEHHTHTLFLSAHHSSHWFGRISHSPTTPFSHHSHPCGATCTFTTILTSHPPSRRIDSTDGQRIQTSQTPIISHSLQLLHCMAPRERIEGVTLLSWISFLHADNIPAGLLV